MAAAREPILAFTDAVNDSLKYSYHDYFWVVDIYDAELDLTKNRTMRKSSHRNLGLGGSFFAI